MLYQVVLASCPSADMSSSLGFNPLTSEKTEGIQVTHAHGHTSIHTSKYKLTHALTYMHSRSHALKFIHGHILTCMDSLSQSHTRAHNQPHSATFT